ncbi:sigma-70 family RNA polymerase sigma factor [Paraflavisolibacter sp. H34]|uniref:RNA polymerase sigma factor n=1 Tax=Huijunlia imazamoxiresistens TaxID=3127457 RepID=UPI003016525F
MLNNIDEELVLRLKEDEADAFNALYWKYHQAVFANIFKLVREEEAARDLLQEVFITLWEKRATLDTEKSVSGWLFVVSYNKSVTYLKKVLQAAVAPDAVPEELPLAEEPHWNVREVQYQLLEEALGQLSPQRRRVFELCKLQGKTYEEAARELNISRYTVKEYLSAAVASIKSYIKDHPDYPLSCYCLGLMSLFLS